MVFDGQDRHNVFDRVQEMLARLPGETTIACMQSYEAGTHCNLLLSRLLNH